MAESKSTRFRESLRNLSPWGRSKKSRSNNNNERGSLGPPTPDTSTLSQTARSSREITETVPSSTHELWEKALENLQQFSEDKELLAIIKEFTSSLSSDTNVTQGDPANYIKKYLEEEIKRLPDNASRIVKKTVSILNKFISVGDVAVSFDPIHAALPWAAVRSVLVVLTASSELESRLIEGVACVTTLTLQCDRYQQLYLDPDTAQNLPQDSLDALKSAIIQAYTNTLLLLGFTIRCKESRSRPINAVFRLEDMDDYIKNACDSSDQLFKAADDCERHCNHQTRATIKQLLTLTEEAHRISQDQAILLINTNQEIILKNLPIAKGVAFDSYAEEGGATCYENTRVALLADVDDWVNKESTKCIFWLQGMAGTGKSTISRTVARNLAKKGALGDSFFFKRGEGDRGKAALFFTTIAAQLAHRYPVLGSYVKHAVENNSDIGDKGIVTQFRELILLPMEKMSREKQNPQTIVIVVDALDECDSDTGAGVIISLLPKLKDSTSLRIKFFITSRPEFPILRHFRNINGEYHDLILHEVKKNTIMHDITVFFEKELSRTRDDYNADALAPLPPDWPGSIYLQILVDQAVPLFIFAKTVCRFIEDRGQGHPGEQLKKILKYQSMGTNFRLHATYFPVLDQMLMISDGSNLVRRSKEERESIIKEFCEIVGTIVLLADPLPMASLASLLEISEEVVAHRLTTKCLDMLMKGTLKKDICQLGFPGTMRVEVGAQTIAENLPPEVQYACLYWAYHLKASGYKVKDNDQVHRFLEHYSYTGLKP
ncbi:hypothetical protein F5884DRAFT_860599 [Xylogone sp. PMI_703]|nr:hypothetical protein F5884DRAFT_860599 [Xylogone sp. PMI_703]